MAEVPRIVRERLRGQAAGVPGKPGFGLLGWEAAGEHPDANLLSAFSERGLSEQERAQVLDHLSRCGECRQVAALSALPQVEEERLVAAVAGASAGASRFGWRSPVVHWGALTAAALVVLIAVATRMQLRQGHSASAPAIANYETAHQSTAATEAVPALPELKQSRKPAPAALPPSTHNRSKAMGGSAGGPASADKLATSKVVSPEAAAQNAPAPRPPPPTAVLEAGKTDGAQSVSELRQGPGRGTGASPGVGRAGGVVGGVLAAPGLKSEATQDRGATLAKRASLSPRWSISDSGALQRSFDGGRSWKEVTVTEGVTFRAVATIGHDVWAGGSSGALYHAADGGEHWSRVRVQANGRTLSGDIVRVEFADIQNGVVTTSTGETWTTSDAGATWHRQ